MPEYKILDGLIQDVQKVLNQWRHDYDLNILGYHAEYDKEIAVSYHCVLLTRTRKESK